MEKLTEDDYAKIVLDLSRRKEERIQAAFQLENALKDESVEALVKGLFTDPSPIVRHELAFALGETAHPKLAAKYLMKAVKTDPNIFVRHESILALATLGDKTHVPFIRKFLNDKDIEMAESAEIALERLDSS